MFRIKPLGIFQKFRMINILLPNFLKWLFRRPQEKKPSPKRRTKPQAVRQLGEEYFTAREVSIALNLSVSCLADYRRKGIGPKYVVFGYRTYRYPKKDVLQYIAEMTRTSTSATRNYELCPSL